MSPRSTAARAPRRLVFLLPALLVALVGGAVTFAAAPPRYRATGTALLTAPRAQAGSNGITVNPYGDLATATTRLATLVAAVGGGDAVRSTVVAAGGHSSYSVRADLQTPLLTVAATGRTATDAVRTADLVLADLGRRFVALQDGSGVPAAQQFTLHAVTTPTSAASLVWRRILLSLLALAVLLVLGLAVAAVLIRRAARNPVPALPRRPLRDRLPRREPAAMRRPVQLGGHAGDLSSVAPAVGHRWEAPIDDTFAEGGRLPLLVPGEDEQQLDDLLDDALTQATATPLVPELPDRYLTRPPTTRVPTPVDVVPEPAAATAPEPVAPAPAALDETAVIEPVVDRPAAELPAADRPAVEPTVIEPAAAAAGPEPAADKPRPAAATRSSRPRSSRRVSAIGYEGRVEPLPADAAFLAPGEPDPLEVDAALTHPEPVAAAEPDPLGLVDVGEPLPAAPAITAHPLGGALLTVKGPAEVVLPAEPPAPAPEPVVVLPPSEPEPAAAPEPAMALPEPVPAPAVRALRGQQPQARHRSESSSSRTRRRPAGSTTNGEDKPAATKTPRASRAKAAQSENSAAAANGSSAAATVPTRSRRADTSTRDE